MTTTSTTKPVHADIAPHLPSISATLAQLLTPAQRACLQAAATGDLHRTRDGYTTATRSSLGTYHQARTVFAMEREGLLAYVEDGDTTRLRITTAGREVREALG